MKADQECFRDFSRRMYETVQDLSMDIARIKHGTQFMNKSLNGSEIKMNSYEVLKSSIPFMNKET